MGWRPTAAIFRTSSDTFALLSFSHLALSAPSIHPLPGVLPSWWSVTCQGDYAYAPTAHHAPHACLAPTTLDRVTAVQLLAGRHHLETESSPGVNSGEPRGTRWYPALVFNNPCVCRQQLGFNAHMCTRRYAKGRLIKWRWGLIKLGAQFDQIVGWGRLIKLGASDQIRQSALRATALSGRLAVFQSRASPHCR